MSYAADVLRQSVRRVLLVQAVLTLLTGAAFFAVFGGLAAFAALYGGAIALIGTWLLGRRVQRTPESPEAGHSGGQLALYAGVLPRFIVTLVLLGIGIGGLKLFPMPLITGFAVAQLGFLINLASNFHPRG
jgi:ATP synthase protein I